MTRGDSTLDNLEDLSELPVLIICYARTSNVINLINQLHRLGICKIYIAIDGPRTQEVAQMHDEFIQSLRRLPAVNQSDIHVWRRNQNLGIAVSVITAIDWFFSSEEYGAVLEDDLLPEDSFFEYLNHFLQVFWSNKSIALISGNKSSSIRGMSEMLSLSNYPQTWGWGTWKTRWCEIRNSAYSMDHIKPKFSLDPIKNFWRHGTRRVLTGKVDTWDIPLAYYMLNSGKTSLLPPVNLVTNIGNDAFATHTLDNENLLHQPAHSLAEMPEFDLLTMTKNIKYINKILEKSVFQVRRLHAFLPFYAIFDSLRPGLLRMDSLEKRLREVSIPH
jgi:hypothetical protein